MHEAKHMNEQVMAGRARAQALIAKHGGIARNKIPAEKAEARPAETQRPNDTATDGGA